MGDSFESECKDYGTRKGCGKAIMMKKDSEGKWHPHNKDGTPHVHFRDEKKTPVKPLAVEVKDILELNEKWIRQLAREEAGKILSEHGIGFKEGDEK